MRIHGTIQDAKTEDPLQGALITLKLGDTVLIENTPSNREGYFNFYFDNPSVSWENQVLTCSVRRGGYLSRKASVTMEEDEAVIDVELQPMPVKWPRIVKLLIIVLIGLIVLTGIGYAVWWLFFQEPEKPPPKPFVHVFKSDRKYAMEGQSVCLTWEVGYADSATLNDKPVLLKDSQDYTVDETTVFTLLAQNESGDSASQSVKVIVPPKPKILAFEAVEPVINRYGSSTLRWETLNAETIYILDDQGGMDELGGYTIQDTTAANALPGEVPATAMLSRTDELDGEVVIYPAASMTFTLVAFNKAGAKTQRKIKIKVLLPPKIDYFKTNQKLIDPGETAILSWKIEEADDITLDDKPMQSFYSMEVAPEETTKYTLVAKNQIGKRVGTVEVKIREKKPEPEKPKPPKILRFHIEPLEIGLGQETTLSWETENTCEVFLNGELVTDENPAIRKPKKDKKYTLTARNSLGETVEWNRSVRVRSSPCTVILYELEHFRGETIEVDFDVDNLDLLTSDNGVKLNNAVSSIRIIGDCSVKVYSAPYFKATFQVFKKSTPKLRGTWIGNNTISSLIIEKNEPNKN